MKTGMLRHSVLAIAAAAALAAAPTSPAQAALVSLDDADGTGWSRQWYTPTQMTHVHTGTTALETGNGQYRFDHAGIVDADNYILEFYVNTKDATPGTNLIVLLNYVLEDTTVEPGIPFDNRN